MGWFTWILGIDDLKDNSFSDLSNLKDSAMRDLTNLKDSTFSDIRKLLTDIGVNAEFTGDLRNAFDGVKSIGDLATLAQGLVTPAGYALYGAGVYTFASVIIYGIRSYQANKENFALEEIRKINYEMLYLQISQLRLESTRILQTEINSPQKRTRSKQTKDQMEMRDLILTGIKEASNILKNTHPISVTHLQSMERMAYEYISYISGDIRQKLYLSDALDYINFDKESILSILNDIIACSKRPVQFSPKPAVLNFLKIVNLFGNEVTKTKIAIYEKLTPYMDALYYEATCYRGRSDVYFQAVNIALFNILFDRDYFSKPKIEKIHNEISNVLEEFKILGDFNGKISSKILLNSFNIIKLISELKAEFEQETKNFQGLAENKKLEIFNIIVLRAIIENCYKLAPYFRFPYNLSSEIETGIESASNTIWGQSNLSSGNTSFKKSVYAHPVSIMSTISFFPVAWPYQSFTRQRTLETKRIKLELDSIIEDKETDIKTKVFFK